MNRGWAFNGQNCSTWPFLNIKHWQISYKSCGKGKQKKWHLFFPVVNAVVQMYFYVFNILTPLHPMEDFGVYVLHNAQMLQKVQFWPNQPFKTWTWIKCRFCLTLVLILVIQPPKNCCCNPLWTCRILIINAQYPYVCYRYIAVRFFPPFETNKIPSVWAWRYYDVIMKVRNIHKK